MDADKYHQMLALADFFDASGADMRERARLGTAILTDPDVVDSAELSQATYAQAEEDIRAATTGKQGLLTRSVELDADALVVRATVLTYRWIDELQVAAFKTLGSIAGRAIGYLAPEVALGGAIVSAGLIETDSLDRDGVAAYLNELAESAPRADGPPRRRRRAARGPADAVAAHRRRHVLRQRRALPPAVACAPSASTPSRPTPPPRCVTPPPASRRSRPRSRAAEPASDAALPASIEDLMVKLVSADRRISVQRIGAGRYIAYLPGNKAHEGGRLRLVGADNTTYVRQVVRAIEQAVEGESDARVMLVGSSYGGAAAAEIASAATSQAFVVDQVVTAGAPSAQVPSIPEQTRVLSLEDRADPVALLGSLINADVANRVTVVYDGSSARTPSPTSPAAARPTRPSTPDCAPRSAGSTELGYLAG